MRYDFWMEEVSGNCGPLVGEIVTVYPDGAFKMAREFSCSPVTHSGCTAHDFNCTSTIDGNTEVMDLETTFASDGSSATGRATITVTGRDGSTCTETYKVTMQLSAGS